MDIKPATTTNIDYPKPSEHFCGSREFLKIAAALGLVTCTFLAPAKAGEPAAKPAKVKIEKIAKDKVPTVVEQLVAKFKNDKYKIREAATVKLIDLGKGKHSAAEDKAAVKKMVIKLLNKKLRTEKDPETRTRLRRVSNEVIGKAHITPVRPDGPMLGGVMVAPQ